MFFCSPWRPIWSLKSHCLLGLVWPLKNPFLGSFHNCILVPQLLVICMPIFFYCILASHLLGITQQFLLFLLWPLFGQITILSLSFITFRVSHFPVSHLTHETVKLGLQNTLNMSKMTRVYFGVLQEGCPQIKTKVLIRGLGRCEGVGEDSRYEMIR